LVEICGECPQKPAVRVVFPLLKSTNPMSWGKTTVSVYPVGGFFPVALHHGRPV
jgi:hypothetical protein